MILDADMIDWEQPINSDCGLTYGLGGWWIAGFDQTGYRSNQWKDLLRRNHGTLNNMEQSDWQTSQRKGGAGRLVFGGTDEYVSTGLSMASLSKFTVAGWFCRAASNALVYMGSNSGGLNVGFQIGFFSDGVLYVSPSVSGAQFMTVASNVTTPLHVVYSFDGSQGTAASRNRLWFNGTESALSGSVTHTSTNASAGTLDIGRRADFGGTYTTGDIDDVQVWRSRVLGHEGLARAVYLDSLLGHPEMLNRMRNPLVVRVPDAASGAVGRGLLCSQKLSRTSLVG